MALPFPDTPFFRGNYGPISMECDAPDLPVRGEIPRALRGSLYRNGPNPQFAPADPAAHHWFLGDGMVHAFHIAEGRVAYRNRWVRTPRWQAEHAAGRALFGGFGPPADPALRAVDSGVANTSVVWHAGRLLALEEAHRPFALDPVTLESLGYHDFGALKVPRFTAHPKRDPGTGELLFFAYGLGGPLGPGMAYGTVDAAGRLTRCDPFEAPYAAMVHDFLATRRHVLFPVLPLTASLDRAMRGGPAFAWDPAQRSRIGVLRRDAPIGTIRWFEGDPCYVFHVLNAWEAPGSEGEAILADVMQSAAAPLFPRADDPSAPPADSPARLTRWRFDLAGATDRFTATPLDDLAGEFPRLDERVAGLPNRVGFFAASTRASPGGAFDSIVRIAPATGQRALFTVPPGDAVSEPVFVPRGVAAPEGEGWLLVVVWRGAENRSDLVVLDAAAPEAGPLATAMLSHRVPHGFHGAWRPDPSAA
ncbi:MAG: carotenoid oxygenase family protein [Acetobacteraceae bacterium]|nr:carotenoid oxygenase family protein [Acetobacteraceae bacterium]